MQSALTLRINRPFAVPGVCPREKPEHYRVDSVNA